MKKEYILYWGSGEKQTVTGESIEDAFSKAGYEGGAIRALDFYEEAEHSDPNEWEFKDGKWQWTKEHKKSLGLL